MYSVKNVFLKFQANFFKNNCDWAQFFRLLAGNLSKNELLQKSFQGFFLDCQNILFPEQLFIVQSWKGFLTSPMLWKLPCIGYTTFLKFCPTPPSCCLQPSPPLLFLIPCFFDWMGDRTTFDVISLNDIMDLCRT